jgi:pimeloyl-ACP methyl ester carboxylesterase
MACDFKPFSVSVADEALDDLKRRLGNTRWPEAATTSTAAEENPWAQGTPLEYLQAFCGYWRDGYDWRRVETELNAYEQIIATIDAQDIHVLHIRSPHAEARPLLMTHGWPGSQVEFLDVIPRLIDPVVYGGSAHDAFHLVLPALPGYGFSGKPTLRGWGVQRIAVAWNTLMTALGYDRYFAQGGDWGAAVTTAIGVLASNGESNCAGIHINMPLVGPDKATFDSLTSFEQKALEQGRFYQEEDSGYAKIQSTRPQSIGYGLVDSPAGLAGWMLEKFHRWSDCDGDPGNVISRDRLIDNLMFYWVGAAGASSARLYLESFAGGDRSPITIPSGCSMFPGEIFLASQRWVERRYTDLVYWNQLERGGHFAAFEQPAVFAREVQQCFAAMRD